MGVQFPPGAPNKFLAGVAKLVDATGLGPVGGNTVGVRVPPSAPNTFIINKMINWNYGSDDPQEEQRRAKMYQEAYAAHMGTEFAQEPLEERATLEDRARQLSQKLDAMRRLRAPVDVIEYTQLELADVIDSIKQGRYIVTKEERDYSTKYWEHSDKFSFTGDWD